MDPGKRKNENIAPTFTGTTHGLVTNHEERETLKQCRHCRAKLLEHEIGHSIEVWGHDRAKPRIVPHRTERCERELPTDIVDVYELTI